MHGRKRSGQLANYAYHDMQCGIFNSNTLFFFSFLPSFGASFVSKNMQKGKYSFDRHGSWSVDWSRKDPARVIDMVSRSGKVNAIHERCMVATRTYVLCGSVRDDERMIIPR